MSYNDEPSETDVGLSRRPQTLEQHLRRAQTERALLAVDLETLALKLESRRLKFQNIIEVPVRIIVILALLVFGIALFIAFLVTDSCDELLIVSSIICLLLAVAVLTVTGTQIIDVLKRPISRIFGIVTCC